MPGVGISSDIARCIQGCLVKEHGDQAVSVSYEARSLIFATNIELFK